VSRLKVLKVSVSFDVYLKVSVSFDVYLKALRYVSNTDDGGGMYRIL
jgi:hypothetical protein